MEADGKLVYCAIPSRLADRAKLICSTVERRLGPDFTAVNPFSVGPYEKFEGNPRIGRERALLFSLGIQRLCQVTGICGISGGVMGEFNNAFELGHDIRTFPEFDSAWDAKYHELKEKYNDPVGRLRGKHQLVIVVGTTAVGKTMWINHLVENSGGRLRRIVTTTTRVVRSGEDDTAYHFVSHDYFYKGLQSGAYLENDEHDGQHYGSSRSAIQDILKKTNGIFALTPTGASQLWRYRYEFNLNILLFQPASPSVLLQNIKDRGITDPVRQHQLILREKDFYLPPDIVFKTVPLTRNKAIDEISIKTALGEIS